MTKTEIVDAAFRVWGRNFYRKTSLSQLAKELGVSKPALYRHFENKNALLTAMNERFFDDFAVSIRADFESALQAEDADVGISTIVTSISSFFAQNVYALIFSLVNIYERNLDGHTMTQRLKSLGADMSVLQLTMEKKYTGDIQVVGLVFATLTFLMSNFHKTKKTMRNPPASEEIQNISAVICKTIKSGLGYSAKKTMLDFENLENQVEGMPLNSEPEPFFKAVAEAVAEAGPWDVSMDMVAKRLGLSKSSLYGHFKNRKDMLRRLFVTEFKHIIEFAKHCMRFSANPAEQLYLGIFSITVYLRSRQEILVVMDWIRTRKLDLGKPEKQTDIYKLFEDVDIEPVRDAGEDEKLCVCHWILFLLINTLMRESVCINKHAEFPFEKVQNNDIRLLYRFITLGLGGFIK